MECHQGKWRQKLRRFLNAATFDRLMPTANEAATASGHGKSLNWRIEMIDRNDMSHRLSWKMKVALALLALVIARAVASGLPDEGSAEKVAAQHGAGGDVSVSAERRGGSTADGHPHRSRASAGYRAIRCRTRQAPSAGVVGTPGASGRMDKNSVGMKMILIPPGEFVMGNSREEIAWARDDLARPSGHRGP